MVLSNKRTIFGTQLKAMTNFKANELFETAKKISAYNFTNGCLEKEIVVKLERLIKPEFNKSQIANRVKQYTKEALELIANSNIELWSDAAKKELSKSFK